ncbi:MAG: AMIN domain-containing protein, partial [Burkholderiaceae bacterium]
MRTGPDYIGQGTAAATATNAGFLRKPQGDTNTALWVIACLCVLLAGLLASASAYAQSNVIEAVSSASRGDTSYLRIRMRQPLKALPPSFTVNNPPRIALDLRDTTNESSTTTLTPEQGEVRGVNIVTAGSRSRIIVSLKQQMQYRATIEGNDLLITLDPVVLTGDAETKAVAPYS